jgi:GMP synthase-like glutamine amidotransferase
MQVIAQALGGRVEINAAGFEIGALDMALTAEARAYFATLLGKGDASSAADAAAADADAAALPAALRMLYVHG